MQTGGRVLDPLASSITTISQHPLVLKSLKFNTKTLGNMSQNNIKQKKQKKPTTHKLKIQKKRAQYPHLYILLSKSKIPWAFVVDSYALSAHCLSHSF
jgi:hypothetical protein